MKTARQNRMYGKAALIALLLSVFFACRAFAAEDLTILFTHDMHDYMYPTVEEKNGKTVVHGGLAKLQTVLEEEGSENSVYMDAGDFSMGTLYQAAFSTDAYELRSLGLAGCEVTTFGNHEFDYGAKGVAQMLRSALNSGDPLPKIVISNIDFSGELDADQQDLKKAFEEYGIAEYVILERAGYRIGVMGLEGYDSIECIQTDIPFTDYKEQAAKTAEKLQAEGCDIIVALSHSGMSGRTGGEDLELAKAVPAIDIIISGHSHSAFDTPVQEGTTTIVACGEYLKNVGRLTVKKENGMLSVTDYKLIPVDEDVAEDAEVLERLDEYQDNIEDTYLADKGGAFDQVIAHSDFNMLSLSEMFATHQEYPVGNLIADSYMHAAKQNGVKVDVALVGLGTIRGSIKAGDITVADAFEICSLGVGADGSAGHPLVLVYISGKDLKLMTELDASLGTLVNSIKMSYSGLKFTFNEKRMLLDRVTDVYLEREDGSREEIEDGKLYRVCANMYAVNMLGMLNGLTKGVLSITPVDADGKPITDFYAVTMKDKNGTEVKEWVAFKNYLESFPVGAHGVSEIPSYYEGSLGRKVKISEGGIGNWLKPGKATNVIRVAGGLVLGVILTLVLVIVLIVRFVKRRRK